MLAGVSGILGFLLFVNKEKQYCRGFWGLALLSFALAVAPTSPRFWTPALYCFGAASACALAGSAYALAGGGARLALAAFAAAKLAGYTLWLHTNRAYTVVLVDGGISLGLVALLHALDWRSRSSRWIFAGAGAAAAGEIVHPVLQVAAAVCFWRGAARMNDRRSA